jgi:predicted CoA-substrate-specific enzyme activase
MNVVAGIDIGSGRTKCALVTESGTVVGAARTKTLPDFNAVARVALEGALRQAGLSRSDLVYVATTGLGRHSIDFRQIQITDITCIGRAVHAAYPGARYVLDIGAQCTRAIRLQDDGAVKEFRTNEKCAAGSGGFLERTARYLEIPLEQVGPLSAKSEGGQAISSICAVLAESEIINHVSEGRSVEDILQGVHVSLAERALLMLKRTGFEGDLVLVGGVALQAGMIKALRKVAGSNVHVPEPPDLVAAQGAALLGWYRLSRAGAIPAA